MLEKKIRKYVIATLDTPTMYLVSLHFGKYMFVDNIETASKTMTKKVAEQIKDYYYHDNPNATDELVVLPLDINYELVEE